MRAVQASGARLMAVGPGKAPEGAGQGCVSGQNTPPAVRLPVHSFLLRKKREFGAFG